MRRLGMFIRRVTVRQVLFLSVLAILLSISDPTLRLQAQSPVAQQKGLLTGTLMVQWADPGPGMSMPLQPHIRTSQLLEDSGNVIDLIIDEGLAGRAGLSRLSGKRV